MDMPSPDVAPGRIRQEAKKAPLRTKNAVALALFAVSHLGGFAPDQIAAAAIRAKTDPAQASTARSIENPQLVRQKKPHNPTYPTQYSQTETTKGKAMPQMANHTPLPSTVKERITRSHGPDSAAIAVAKQQTNEASWGKQAKKNVQTGPEPKEEFENLALTAIQQVGSSLLSFVDNLANFQLVSCSAPPNLTPMPPTAEPTKISLPTPTVELVGLTDKDAFAKSLESPTPEMKKNYSQFYEYIDTIKNALRTQFGADALQFKPKALIPDKATFESNLSQGAMPIVAITNPGGNMFSPAFWGQDLRIVAIPNGQLMRPEGSVIPTPIIMAPVDKDGHLVTFSPGLGVFIDQKFLPNPDQSFFTTLSSIQPKIVEYAKSQFKKYDGQGLNPITNIISTPMSKNGQLVFVLETKTQDGSHDDFAVMDSNGKITAAPELPGKKIVKEADGTLRYYVEGVGANAGEYYPTDETFNLLTQQVVKPTPTPTPDVQQQLAEQKKTQIISLFQTQLPTEKGTAVDFKKSTGERTVIIRDTANPTHFWYLSEDGKTLEEIKAPEFVKNISWGADKDALSFVNDKGVSVASWSDADKINLKQITWNWKQMSEQEKKSAYQWNFDNIKFIKGQTPNITDEQFRRFDEMIRKSTRFMPKTLPSPEETGINFPSKFPRDLLPPFSIDTLFEASSKFKGLELTQAQQGFFPEPNTRTSLISTAAFISSPQQNFTPFDIYTYGTLSYKQLYLLSRDNLSSTSLSSADKQKVADAYGTVFEYLVWSWIYDNYPSSIKKDYYNLVGRWINNTVLSQFK